LSFLIGVGVDLAEREEISRSLLRVNRSAATPAAAGHAVSAAEDVGENEHCSVAVARQCRPGRRASASQLKSFIKPNHAHP
jgi:hypothetical protein